eukprot:COSAG02_NODE_4865_length_4888_cov_2.731259_1_plen_54_part_00
MKAQRSSLSLIRNASYLGVTQELRGSGDGGGTGGAGRGLSEALRQLSHVAQYA